MDVPAARETLAAAAATVLECAAYPPDKVAAPAMWVDSLSLVYEGGTFCSPASGTATLVGVAQRHDRAESIRRLESAIPRVVEALSDIPGVRVTDTQTGVVQVAGQDLPGVTVTVQFHAS
jgi:hypothetical protein